MTVVGAVHRIRPGELRAGAHEAVLAQAWAFDQRHPVARAWLACAEWRVPAVALRLGRPEVYQRFRGTSRRSIHALRSGMLLSGVMGPLEAGLHRFELTVETVDGRTMVAIDGSVRAVDRATTGVEVPDDVDVAVAMATYNPPLDLFALQIESIRRQDNRSWCCVISDDGSSPSVVAGMKEIVGTDSRFRLVHHHRRLGFYANFERALEMVPPSVRFVALADQDDVWHPDKLARQLAVLADDPLTTLVASDVRVTRPGGVVVAGSFYEHRAPTNDDPASLFVVNSLIGASMVFRRAVLDRALPFPRAFEDRFHDHWIARTAAMTGRIAFVDQPLHDYVQHGGNAWGDRVAERRPLRSLLPSIARRGLGGSVPDDWQLGFIGNVLEPAVAGQVLVARCGPSAPPPWLAPIMSLERGQARAVARAVLDHFRDSRTQRPCRENVELPILAGRVWAFDHPAQAEL